MSLIETVEELVRRRWPTNTWLEYDQFRVFVRRSQRMLDGCLVSCFDIANLVVVRDIDFMSLMGRVRILLSFFRWMANAERIAGAAGLEMVFVENVLNTKLIPSYLRVGYEVYGEREGGVCLFKRLGGANEKSRDFN